LRANTRMKVSKLKFAVFAYLASMVAIHAAIFWSLRDSLRKGYSDFVIYYCAGTMVRQGLGHQLYDDTMQFKVQREFSPEVAIRQDALPYNHPPFEAALFVPFTYTSYPSAFVLWDLANLGMLITLPFLLRPHLPQLQNYPWPLWLLTSLAFFPIFAALLQGQDAILLLGLYALAFVGLKRNRDGLAGGWLALGLFKPHLVLPLILLLLVQGRKKILYGFLPIATVLALISTAIVGKERMLLYPSYVANLEGNLARGAIIPSDMPNLRGALNILFPGISHIVPVVLVISLGVFLYAAWKCRNRSLFDLNFSLVALTTVLVSYHAMIYDLSLLMVPVLLLANELLAKGKFHGYRSVLMTSAMAIFFFAPLQLVLSMRDHRSAVMGWVLLLWLSGIAAEISFRTTAKAQGEI
jgi:Glycosyltransferase family 87